MPTNQVTRRPANHQALAGVKVIELCQMVAGPYCGKLMADLGAEVVKVEPPGTGDAARHRAPFVSDQPHPERSLLFLYVNTSKLSITLDVASQEGQRILERLARNADILIEDFQPSQAERLGLDYPRFQKLNPRLVMTSITPFGRTGPYRDYKAYPLNTFHAGGEGYLTPVGAQYLGRPPVRVGKYVGEYASGLNAAVVTLAALFWQRISGQGQHIDVSQQESLIALNPIELNRYPNHNMVASRASRITSYGGTMPCRDGYIELSLYEEHEWRALVELMDNPAWAREERFKDIPSRVAHGVELNQLIAEWSKQHTKAEIVPRGQALGCPIAAYNTTKEVCESRQLAARGFFAEIRHPVAGTFAYPTSPYHFSKTPWKARRHAPLLGQDNELIYRDRLDYGEEEIAEFRRKGTI